MVNKGLRTRFSFSIDAAVSDTLGALGRFMSVFSKSQMCVDTLNRPPVAVAFCLINSFPRHLVLHPDTL